MPTYVYVAQPVPGFRYCRTKQNKTLFMKVYNWLICNTYKHICKMKIIASHLPVVHFPFSLSCVYMCGVGEDGCGGLFSIDLGT